MAGLAWDVVRVDPARRRVQGSDDEVGNRRWHSPAPRRCVTSSSARSLAARSRCGFWDEHASCERPSPGAPTFTFHSPLALAHVLRAPGELGLGRAYVSGLLDVDDLDAALLVVDTFEPPSLTIAQQRPSRSSPWSVHAG